MKERVLIVEDEFVEANYVQLILEKGGHSVIGIARSVNSALKMLEKEVPDIVLLDIFLNGPTTGIQLARLLNERGIAFVYLSANSNAETFELAKSTEPYGFLVKPFQEKNLLITMDIALYLHRQKLALRRRDRTHKIKVADLPDEGFQGIIGKSQKLQQVIDDLQVVAPTDTSVLILGETGTGKELIADAIHALSPVAKGPLIKVNCAALPATLIESTLFGHEQGAFTGATQKRKGKFEQAQNGTIFLDEIGELGADIQMKLLRVLQNKEIEPLGSEHTIKVNCRIIAATNKDLEKEVAEGQFRMDLYYRLHVFTLTIPPLRERPEDIPLLARHFTALFSRKHNKPVPKLSSGLIDELTTYHWSGNVREMEHSIERAILLSNEETLKSIPLPSRREGLPDPAASSDTLDEVERRHIIEVLRKCNGKVGGKGGAAEILNLNTSTLHSRMKKLGITKHKYIS